MSDILKRRSLKALAWSACESVVALAGAFICSFNVIIGTTFADALVQRLDLEPGHIDAAFWTTRVAALPLAGASFVAAG